MNTYFIKPRNLKRAGGKFEKSYNKINEVSEEIIDDSIKIDWDIDISFSLDDGGDNIRFIDYGGENVIYAGTFNELIKNLTNPNLVDAEYVKIFLLTYKSFATPSIFLQKLFEQYRSNSGTDDNCHKIRTKCISVLVKWIEEEISDFNPDMISKVVKFIEEININYHVLSQKLEITLDIKLAGISPLPTTQFNENAPPPKIPKDLTKISILNIHVTELARQICLMDHEFFSAIRTIEFIDQSWINPKLKYRAVNVLRMIKRFNNISKWATHCILKEKSLKIRSKVYNKILELSWCLFELKNFSGTLSIISGLDNAAIYRLKYTKEKITEELEAKYNEIKRVMETSQSFKIYREHLSKSIPPCIPHLGLLLTDLVFIGDGNPDIIDNRLINFHKRRLIIKNILSFNLYQTTPYNFQRVDVIHDYLTNYFLFMERFDDDSLFDISLAIEPKGWDGVSPLL